MNVAPDEGRGWEAWGAAEDHADVVSLSGGKDSLATLLVALETRPHHTLHAVFADTGNEHPLTYEWIEGLRSQIPIRIETVRADTESRLAHRRRALPKVWGRRGIDEATIARAQELLHPTGNPFLDLCLVHGRFPAAQARWCTVELKVEPIRRHLHQVLDTGHRWVWQWLGLRRSESVDRRHTATWVDLEEGIGCYRPIVGWDDRMVIEAARSYGIALNPLYSQGMRRVGCMPCIYEAKASLRNIAQRWPEVIDRIREWEALVSQVAPYGRATLFHRWIHGKGADAEVVWARERIDEQVEWAMTTHGGRQYDLLNQLPPPSCSSVYGLCEAIED